jgi:hypothetical protein
MSKNIETHFVKTISGYFWSKFWPFSGTNQSRENWLGKNLRLLTMLQVYTALKSVQGSCTLKTP